MKDDQTKKPSLEIMEEQLSVNKEVVDSGKVYINKKVVEETEKISVPVAHEEVEVTRVAVNKPVDTPPEIRYEGNTTVIPVIKEVLVVEKKLMLVEEIHVTKHVIEKKEERSMPLRKEEVNVEKYSKKNL